MAEENERRKQWIAQIVLPFKKGLCLSLRSPEKERQSETHEKKDDD